MLIAVIRALGWMAKVRIAEGVRRPSFSHIDLRRVEAGWRRLNSTGRVVKLSTSLRGLCKASGHFGLVIRDVVRKMCPVLEQPDLKGSPLLSRASLRSLNQTNKELPLIGGWVCLPSSNL